MKDTLAQVCALLAPERDARHLAPEEAVRLILDRWDRKRLEHFRELARVAICKLAVLPLHDAQLSARAQAWARQEAPHWWAMFNGLPAPQESLVALYARYVEEGRI